jgi:putative ABC transport system permease protein
MLKYNIRIALRNLFRLKSHTIISLTGLIIGLACVFVISAWTIQELQYDRFHEQSESIYMVTTEIKDNNDNVNSFPETPPPLAEELKENIPAIENSFHFIYLYGGRLIKRGNKSFKETGIAADPILLEILNFKLREGSLTSLGEPNSILLTEKLSQKLFPNEMPVGKNIIYGKDKLLNVRVIINDIPENSSLKFDYIISYQIVSGNPNEWWQLSDATFIKTRLHADINEIKNVAQEVWRKRITDEQYDINFIPITKLRYGAKFDFFNAEHGNYQKLYAFMGIALLILVLACLNYTNLVSAYSIKRANEVSIRKVNGASSNSLLKYFITESSLVSVIAWILAVLLAKIFIHFFQLILNVNISFKYLNFSFCTGFFAALIIVGLISGIYPAIMTSSILPFNTKATCNNNSFRFQGKLKNVFVLSQFILSISLTIACLVIFRQTNYINNFNVGYEKENIIRVELPQEDAKAFQAIKNDFVANSNIEQVCFAGASPVNLPPIFTTENWKWEGLKEGTPTSIYRLYVDHNYLNVFQIPLIEGRFFSSSKTDTDKVVINEKLATLIGSDNPAGKTIRHGDNKFEIIGIVKDFHFQHLTNNIHPLLFMYSDTKNNMFVKINHNSQLALEQIHRQFAKFSDQPFSFRFVNEEYNDLYKNEKKISIAILVFTIMTIILSCIGLIGLVIFNTEIKTKEIGVRKVYGATTNEIILMLNKSILKRFLTGFIISCILSWIVMNKWLENFTFRVTIDWRVFITGGLIIMVIVTFTVSWLTWKAAIKNPMDTLKYE